MALTWDDLFLKGSVVNLTVARWPARVRITPADLGIEDSAEVDRALALGSHRLLPGTAFEAIDGAARRAKRSIDSMSLPFGLLWGARFVPDAQMDVLAVKMRQHRADFLAAVDDFIKKYGAAQEQMLPVIKKALQDAARTPEAAEAAFRRVANEYPPAEVVRARFALSWSVYAIQGPRAAGVTAALQDEAVEVRSAIADMVGGLREEVTGKLREVLALIQKGGKLTERSITAAMAVLDHVDKVNVLGDMVLLEQVSKLRRALQAIERGAEVPADTISGLAKIKEELETSVAAAVANAEARLTAVGRRKLQVA